MLSQAQAVEKLKQLIRASRRLRAWHDAFWALQMLYDRGSQWGYIDDQPTALVVKQLRRIVDPNRQDVRVAVNLIHSHNKQVQSKLAPHRIDAYHRPRSGNIDDQLVANVANRFMAAHLDQINALAILRRKEDLRCTLGTAVIRRTLVTDGRPIAVGKRAIRNFRIGWALCPPWEFLREPGASSCQPGEDEEVYAHEKPRTVEWVRRHFGVSIETECTIGKLLEHHRQVQAACGRGFDIGVSDSKAKGVLVYEAYFRDPEEAGDWAWTLFGYVDPTKNRDEVQVLSFVRNPFYGLPFHHFNYDRPIQGPWGLGIPALAMANQDLFNISVTSAVRVMQQGAGQIVIEENTVEDPERALSNRLDKPVVWRRKGTHPHLAGPPTRLAGPQMPTGAAELMQACPVWLSDALNLREVQRGEPVRRGESGEAYKIRLAEANAPLEFVRRDDELELQTLLYGTWVDMANPSRLRLDTARRLLGPDVPDEHIAALVRRPPQTAISSVRVLSGTVRPKTPAEVTESFIEMSRAQILDPDQAQWEMLLQGNVVVNTPMARAYRKQLTEIRVLAAGGEAMPVIAENHGYHIRAIELFVADPEWLTYAPDARQRILAHYAAHMEAQQALNSLMGPPTAAPNQGSPPAATGEGLAAMAGGPSPEMRVA